MDELVRPKRGELDRRSALVWSGTGLVAAVGLNGACAHRSPVAAGEVLPEPAERSDPLAPPEGPELADKEARVRALLQRRGLDALWLRRVSSFAWATGGAASYINTAVEAGEASLLYTPEGRFLLTSNIEAPRLEKEEGLRAQGWQPLYHHWYEAADAARGRMRGLRLGVDCALMEPGAVDVSAELARLRARLLPVEERRFRALGRRCAAAMAAAVARVRPGQSEHRIAAVLAEEAVTRGVWPVVDLVATDERIFELRHPLPTQKRLARYAMLVLCGRQRGLVCSLTRLIHFGPLSDELRRKEEAVARIDAAFLRATRMGATLGAVFERARSEYAALGFPDEWRRHHQGGAAGYEPREYLGTPGSTDVVDAGQAYAWNPSISGAKSEDTVLVGPTGCEVLTEVLGWPALSITSEGQTLQRPAILTLR